MRDERLAMALGEAIFTERSIRRLRPGSLPVADLRLLVEAAVRAPNGAYRQIAWFNRRRPTSETTYLDRWGGVVPWT